MKKTSLLILITFSLFACKGDKNIPDVSTINVDIKIERFDKDFFAIDTTNVFQGLDQLNKKYPEVTPIFLQYILGVDSSNVESGIKNFIRLSKGSELYEKMNSLFKSTTELEKEFKRAFQFVKYYFPKYLVPTIATIAGPVDALAQSDNGPTPDFLRPGLLGISLQFYLGEDFAVYKDPFFIENVAPTYRSRRFSKEYLIADAMQLIVSDLFSDKSSGKPLIEQMVEKGKQWFLLDKFLPGIPDSIKTGYTKEQLEWCNDNEGLIWAYIVKNENLQSLNPSVIQIYIGESPFTQGFSPEYSPGNIGQWIGWQFIKKFAEKNPELKPEEIMQTDAATIISQAKYKPK